MARGPAVGEIVPDFELPEAYGGKVRLSDVLARDTALIAFYPSDFGAMCAVEMKALQNLNVQFREQRTQVLGVSTNSAFVHSAWKSHLNLPFPLLADFDGKMSDRYGVLVREEGYMLGRCKRGVFIIDRGGVLRYKWITEDHASEPDYDELLAVCSELLR